MSIVKRMSQCLIQLQRILAKVLQVTKTYLTYTYTLPEHEEGECFRKLILIYFVQDLRKRMEQSEKSNTTFLDIFVPSFRTVVHEISSKCILVDYNT